MEYIKQTGLLVKPIAPENYVMGAYTKLTAVARMPSMQWADFLPTREKQHAFNFDTLSCTTFSALNQCEMQGRWLLDNGYINLAQLAWLQENGYFDENGNLNFSDRFTAIMSGTTKWGNDFVTVWESIRKDGLLPERDFPFQASSFEDYQDRSKITSVMIGKAKEFLKIFDFKYEWVFFKESETFTEAEQAKIKEALTHAPLHIGIAIPATHAITLYSNEQDVLDHYEPFTYKYKGSIHFGMKGYMNVKENTKVYIYTKTLKKGDKGNLVKDLQESLNSIGYNCGIADGIWGKKTEATVRQFQKENGLVADGYFGPKSAVKVSEIQKKN
ncbi:MAG: peptidoglycan-binding protein [bacterium]|nr:peptidoglycan-binding protein [bacterium]